MATGAPSPSTGFGPQSGAFDPVEIAPRIFLCLNSEAAGPRYPTSSIRRGLALRCEARELLEEGLGFGVPLIKFGNVPVFPGSRSAATRSSAGQTVITIRFVLDLVETTTIGDRTAGRQLQSLRNGFSALHRGHPRLRPAITLASSYLRRALRLGSRFERRAPVGEAAVSYTIDAGQSRIRVQANLDGLAGKGCTEIILANEQGGHYFDHCLDSGGLDLHGQALGSWDESTGRWASFIDARDNVAFTLHAVPGARMFRGREVERGRLAWAGLNYVVPPETSAFAYDIHVGTP
ncbi:MAG: hypothetical protein HY673_20695 [Chloroflexi bacterium]|nr:hypothetical protein [Chloroflexota bacterium]